MVPETLSLRRIFHRFFPSKTIQSQQPTHCENLNLEEKQKLAMDLLGQGELALMEGNLEAISLFESATQLWPSNSTIWYRQGLAFYDYGTEEGREKALLLASKQFKIAVQHDPLNFEAWAAWGNVLLHLGRFHDEHHFHQEARDKYQKAIALGKGKHPEILAKLHWDHGIVWTEIANHSGEALDFHLAIQAFQSTLEHTATPPAEFWNDYGSAYLKLALLVNEERLIQQGADLIARSVENLPNYLDGWLSLGQAYGQLYLTSMDERFCAKSSDCYARAVRLSPKDAEIWLSWAELLCESGRVNKKTKSLVSSLEKCTHAAGLAPQNSDIVCQWVVSLSYLGVFSGRLDLLNEAEQKIIQATEEFPDDPDLWHAYGICLMAFAQYYEDVDYDELAIEKLQYGLSIDRTNAEIWHALGTAHKHVATLIDDPAMIERATRFFAKAMELKACYPALIFDAACALLHHSEALDSLPSLEQAIVHFESLLQNHRSALLHHPEWLFEYANALNWLGDYTGEVKDFARAIEVYSHVLLIEPDYPKIHLQTALTYIQMGHAAGESEYYKRSLHHFRLALRQDEENDELWLNWGLALVHLAHLTIDTEFMDQLFLDAEEKLTKAGRLGNLQAHYHLAGLYSILGRTQESMDHVKKALAAKAIPSMEELLHDDWLENLRSTEVFSEFILSLEAKLQAREQ